MILNIVIIIYNGREALLQREIQSTQGVTPTKYRYTGQLAQAELGLDYYVARWYDPAIGHFTQADTIVPEPGKASAFDRYAYVQNNPLRYNDPSGHDKDCGRGDPGCKRQVTKEKTEKSPQPQNRSQSNSEGVKKSYLLPPTEIFSQKEGCVSEFCLNPNKSPKSWDLEPSNPDYYILTVNVGEIEGGSVTLTFDRYNNVYFGVGVNAGKSITPITGSLNGGYIGSAYDNKIPDQGNIGDFLEGWAINGQIGALGDIAYTRSLTNSPYISHDSYEFGGILPAVFGVSITHNWLIWNFSQ